eukprot:TRINITY_DN2258_c0_g2_i1.p1 TRINITY_DN2258_c0_g2~~TRINITY_DN2258_c0_g2_i1.p1  ORF type:complete len:469 (-),score=111.05 TRINITY_DN2258_c0_g2_i1:151-1515(-)
MSHTTNDSSSSSWDDFKSTFSGPIIRPGDDLYESARKGWNGDMDKRPLAIVRPTSKKDITNAILFAKKLGVPFTAKCGGHSLRCIVDDGIVLDLCLLRQVDVDVANKTARVQGGCHLADLDGEAWKHDRLAVTGGQVSHTGVSGLALGGGFGYIGRKFGMSCDNILSMDVILASGENVTVSKDNHPDLYWAMRGAGHNFGIVYEFTFQLYSMPEFTAGTIIHPRPVAKEVLKVYASLMESAPDELSVYVNLANHPQMGSVLIFTIAYVGNVEECEKALGALSSWGTPLVKDIRPTDYPELQKRIDPLVAHGRGVYNWDGLSSAHLDDAFIDAVLGHFDQAPPTGMSVISALGGAVRRPSVTGPSSFPHRDKMFLLAVAVFFPLGNPDSEERTAAIAWARKARAYITSDYVNSDGDTSLERSYGAFDNIARLVEIKKKYDPDNFFSVNRNLITMK